ncbi:hypothetical protein MIT9_P0509 [Methylomarinovum caldicuralii]|uniref:Uncharacterized protein n=1 Tax=Methylomarinovum caldicuralii TaxID=438856 RepID=A0AAU9C659_9GAMM|nr:hypothetical protein [Methylomarinovum caldicuralii]BCX80931.1 hypothetical protein MIT9_P0509 [Methylomarinovum caldicuralii]
MKHLIVAFCLLLPLFAQADESIYPARTYPLASPPAAHQQAARHDTNVATELLAGFASFLVTPVYGAFKLTFAGLGALTGGLAWAFTGGDERVAREIWQTTMGGTYVITPDHLAGRKPVRFTGDS